MWIILSRVPRKRNRSTAGLRRMPRAWKSGAIIRLLCWTKRTSGSGQTEKIRLLIRMGRACIWAQRMPITARYMIRPGRISAWKRERLRWGRQWPVKISWRKAARWNSAWAVLRSCLPLSCWSRMLLSGAIWPVWAGWLSAQRIINSFRGERMLTSLGCITLMWRMWTGLSADLTRKVLWLPWTRLPKVLIRWRILSIWLWRACWSWSESAWSW